MDKRRFREISSSFLFFNK